MKKKIILTLAIMSMFVCIFAISISASTIYQDTDGNQLFSYEVDGSRIITSYEGSFPKEDAQGNALTWYVTGTKTEDGNTVKTVASVLTTDNNYFSITDGVYEYITKTVTQYNVVSVNFPNDAEITSLSLANNGYRENSATYNHDSSEMLFLYLPTTLTELPSQICQGTKILVCNIPDEVQIETITRLMFHKAQCLREINIPSSVKAIEGVNESEGAAFYGDISLERVTFGSNDTLETIGNYVFQKSGLKYITLPDSVKTIGQHAFSYTQLINSPFTEKSRLESIGGRAFGNISTLQTFIVPSTITFVEMFGEKGYNDYGPLAESTVQLVTFGNADTTIPLAGGLFGRARINKIVFAEWITAIPSWYFVTATIDDITFGENVATIGERVFQGANVNKIRLGANFKYFTNSLSDHQSFTYNANSVQEIYIPASFYAEAPKTVYQVSYAFHCGNSSNVKFFYTGTKEQLETSMSNFLNSTKSPTDNNGKFTGATKISWAEYSANPNNYASGNYIIYNYNPCDAFYEGEHTYFETIEYPNGYAKNGLYNYGCSVDGCTEYDIVDKALDPIFIAHGYSTNEAQNAINGGYTVNFEMLNSYKAKNGNLRYGVLITNANSFTGEIFDSKHKVTSSKSIQVEMGGEYANFNCTIDYGTNTGVELELVITAYTIDEAGNVTFIQSDSAYAENTTIGSRTLKKITLQKVIANVSDVVTTSSVTKDNE